MLRSWIGMVFERSRQDRKLLLNCVHDELWQWRHQPTKTLFLAKSSQLHTHNASNIPSAEDMAQRALTTRYATPQKCLGTRTNS